MTPMLDQTDRRLINLLQDGIAICDEPFAAPAAELGIAVEELLLRLQKLKQLGMISRLGPMYNAERLGGGLTLCAMAVPPCELDRIAEVVNAFPEVAHNYERDHSFNMWFVLATETASRALDVIAEITRLTGIKVLNLPKTDEFFVGLKVEA